MSGPYPGMRAPFRRGCALVEVEYGQACPALSSGHGSCNRASERRRPRHAAVDRLRRPFWSQADQEPLSCARAVDREPADFLEGGRLDLAEAGSPGRAARWRVARVDLPAVERANAKGGAVAPKASLSAQSGR